MQGHGGMPSLDWPGSMQYFRVAVVGAGGVAPTLPAGKLATLVGPTPDFPAKANAVSRVAAEIPTRSGVGAYTVTIDPSFSIAKILNTPIEVYGVAGMWASVTSVVGRVLTVTTYNAGGAATDLTTSCLLVISCECQDSNA